MGLGGLTSLLGGKSSIASAGAQDYLDTSNTSEDILLGILNSRTALVDVIKRYNLMSTMRLMIKIWIRR
ncbi:MAG: hypothetical protein MZV64_38815 [Ignavibacteriales bacterium]|nr:hypothetical protein [Ignavibacteriales bacterium]